MVSLEVCDFSGGGWCLFICLFVFRNQPTKKMLSSYTTRSVLKKKISPAAWGPEGAIQRYECLFGVSRKYCMHKDKNAWLFLLLLLPKTHLKEGRRKRKRYFYVRTEEITLGVCHRLDRKSHYKLTPELEFQLTTSTTRAFTLFSQTGHPAERNTFPWVRGKLCPCHFWGLGGNSLSFSPSRQECAAGHSLQ